MPRKRKAMLERETHPTTYAELEHILTGIMAGRDKLHEQIDEIMERVAAHKGHEQDEAKEWPRIQAALESLLVQLQEQVHQKHQVGSACLRPLLSVTIQHQSAKDCEQPTVSVMPQHQIGTKCMPYFLFERTGDPAAPPASSKRSSAERAGGAPAKRRSSPRRSGTRK